VASGNKGLSQDLMRCTERLSCLRDQRSQGQRETARLSGGQCNWGPKSGWQGKEMGHTPGNTLMGTVAGILTVGEGSDEYTGNWR
jgi:hypothetical protein